MNDLLQPKEIQIVTQSGETRTYVISKPPAIAGRELATQYPTANMPKLGDYKTSEDLMLKLMNYVAVVRPDGSYQRLSNRALVDNHVPDWETLMKLEAAMIEYNVGFFARGGLSGDWRERGIKAAEWIFKTLMGFLVRSLQEVQPPSKS